MIGSRVSGHMPVKTRTRFYIPQAESPDLNLKFAKCAVALILD